MRPLVRIGRLSAAFLGSNLARGAVAFALSLVIGRTLGVERSSPISASASCCRATARAATRATAGCSAARSRRGCCCSCRWAR